MAVFEQNYRRSMCYDFILNLMFNWPATHTISCRESEVSGRLQLTQSANKQASFSESFQYKNRFSRGNNRDAKSKSSASSQCSAAEKYGKLNRGVTAVRFDLAVLKVWFLFSTDVLSPHRLSGDFLTADWLKHLKRSHFHRQRTGPASARRNPDI